MRTPSHRRTTALVAGAALATLLVRSASAGMPNSADYAAGKSVSAVKLASDTAAFSTSSTSWTDIAGASVTVTIPATWGAGLITARFSANVMQCFGGISSSYCSVRILVGGVEAKPAAGNEFAFVRNGEGGARSMDRYLSGLPPGSYVVKAQAATVNDCDGCKTFELDDWTLTVERARVS